MYKKIIAITLLTFITSGIFAQKNEDNIELNELEVNADRTKMYSNLGRIITIIDKIQIEQSAIRSIDDLLNYVAGIDVRQRGINGVQADVSIRGGSFDQILVLINGVNITDPQTGHYNLDIPIDISDINRVEILQGSAARVLGPNAFSGAINIITNNNGENRLSSQISAGSYGYLSNIVSGKYSKNNYNLFSSVSHRKSNGYISNTDYDISNAFIQTGLKSQKSGNFNLQLSYQQKSFGANSFYSFTYPNQFEHTKTFFSALTWDYKSGNWTFDTQLYWRQHHDRFELFRNFEGAENFPWYKDHNYHKTDVSGGKSVISNLWKGGKTSLGIDIRNEHIFSTVLGETIENNSIPIPFEKGKFFTKETNRLISTVFLDHSLNLGQWHFSAGAATTSTKKFGTYFNGGADIAYRFSDYSRVFISANSAVRLPTFTDLYYQSANHISNPNLKPEKSMTFEVGTKINPLHWTLTASGFYRLGNNIIDWVRMPGAEKYESQNLTTVNAAGFEMSYEYRFFDFFIRSVGMNYTFLSLDKKADSYDSKYALDYLKHKIVLNLNHSIWSHLSAQWNLAVFDRSGKYTDFTTNNLTEYAPYVMLNSKLMWKMDRLTLFAEGNNLLNQKYVELGGIEQPGTNFNFGITLTLF